MCHIFDKPDWFFKHVETIRNRLSDYEEAGNAPLEGVLIPLFWDGADEEQRRRTAAFATDLLERLGQLQIDWPGKPPGAEPRQGLNQKQVARMIGMSSAAMTAVKSGTGSPATINRIAKLAIIRGVLSEQGSDGFACIEDNVRGMVMAMNKVVELLGKTNSVLLDEATYRCVRSALNCEAWHRARDEGDLQEETRLASELLAQAEVGEREKEWLREVFSEWAAVLEVVLDELDGVLNS